MTYKYSAKEKFDLPESPSNKIPMCVGYYLSDPLCTFKIQKGPYKNQTFYFYFGESFCFGIDKMLNSIFSNAILLDSLGSSGKNQKIEAIVLPEISSGNILLPMTKFKDIEMLIRIKYTVIDNNKNVLWIDDIQGEGITHWNKKFLLSSWNPPLMIYRAITQQKSDMVKCMRLTLEDHFKNAYSSFINSKFWTN